ncbi:MAG: AraC family transcriptional regulator ligand-binding domain-containing protein [Deltaproteobacteria bacterium]|nr:AraC family transcriptional regulator ligand-binding domain-containing protein [Deltaproteobacteria bacterium]
MVGVPAQTVEALLAGMAAIGLDVLAIRRAAGLPEEPSTLDEVWPAEPMGVVWEHAMRRFPRVTLGAEVGLAVPFGAFGVLDYLVASSANLGGGLNALVMHFGSIAGANPALTLVQDATDVRLEVRAAPQNPRRFLGEELSLAIVLRNLRHIAAEPVPLREIQIARPDPDAALALSSLFDAPVRPGLPVSALCLAPSVMSVRTRTADAQLQRTMRMLASDLRLGSDAPFEQAIRARLRELLPRGDTAATTMARMLGTSERTLHRRLNERNTTWRNVLDAFRSDESKRLLRERRASLAEVALAVGFSDQTAWTRAFRRWTGKSPAQWLRGD